MKIQEKVELVVYGYGCLLGVVMLTATCIKFVHVANGDSSDWSSWVQAIGSIAAIGAGFLGLSIQRQTQANRDEEAARESSRQLLVSLQTEISVSWKSVRGGIGDAMLNVEAGDYFKGTFTAYAQPFAVFHASAGRLGALKDDEARRKVISAFVSTQGLYALLGHYSDRFLEHGRTQNSTGANGQDIPSPSFNDLEQFLVSLTKRLQAGIREVDRKVAEMTALSPD